MSRLTILVSTLVLLVVLGVFSLFWQSRTATASTPDHAFISEYIEDGNDKAIEIYNGTGTTIDLGVEKYVVQIIKPDAADETIALSGTIANDTTWVVVYSEAQEALKAKEDQSSPALDFNGDDAVILSKDGVFVDVLGEINVDPGAKWGTGLSATENSDLRRRCGIFGDASGDDPFIPGLEWDGFVSSDFTNLGIHVGICNVENIPPHIVKRSPMPESDELALDSAITLNFSEAVTVTDEAFLIWCNDSGLHTAIVSGGPLEFSLDLEQTFSAGERCQVFLLPPRITDMQNQWLNEGVEWVFSFASPQVSVWEIQGASHVSPFLGKRVVTTESIVTKLAGQGFWVQSINDDADEATSNGIYVATTGAPNVEVGQTVVVTGVVAEVKSGEDYPLSVTRLQNASVREMAETNSLPTPIVLDGSGRTIPKATIDDDRFTTYDPDEDAIDFFESLEGMLVQIDDAVVVGPTKIDNGNETWIIANASQNPGPFTPRGGIYIREDDYNPERILLQTGDDQAWQRLSVGSHLTATGVLQYFNSTYRVIADGEVEVDTSGVPTREVTTLIGDPDHLTVATFNVENLGANLSESEFIERADLIVNHLGSPDIIVIEEIQDNNGSMNDTTIDASFTFTRLISTIRSLGGPSYQFQQLNPSDGFDGGAGGANIRVGFLYSPTVEFVARAGDASVSEAVICTNGEPSLNANPTRFAVGHPAYVATRKPLVGQFSVDSHSLFVVGIHFSSKIGDAPTFGTAQPPILETERKRIQQATVVNKFVAEILTCDPNANVIVLGDMNDYPFSPALGALKGEELVNLIELLPENERYSYVFQGNSQVLDQILVSHNITNTMQPEYDIVHVNAEFDTQVSDHDPSVARFALPLP